MSSVLWAYIHEALVHHAQLPVSTRSHALLRTHANGHLKRKFMRANLLFLVISFLISAAHLLGGLVGCPLVLIWIRVERRRSC